MGFPNKPWVNVLDIPPPPWATHQVDFTTDAGDSHSVWVNHNQYQYFRTTSDDDDLVMEEAEDSNGWDAKEWAKRLGQYSYSKVIDLQPIVENE